MGDKQQCSHLCLIFRYGRVLLHAKELKSFYDVYISVVFMLKTDYICILESVGIAAYYSILNMVNVSGFGIWGTFLNHSWK